MWNYIKSRVHQVHFCFLCGDQIVERTIKANQRSFTASSLEMGKRYIVTIIAYRGYKRSKMVETIFKTGLYCIYMNVKLLFSFTIWLFYMLHCHTSSLVGLQHSFPMDCVQIMKNGNKNSGIYTVYINNNRSKPIEAFCDMNTDGGGWLVGFIDQHYIIRYSFPPLCQYHCLFCSIEIIVWIAQWNEIFLFLFLPAVLNVLMSLGICF